MATYIFIPVHMIRPAEDEQAQGGHMVDQHLKEILNKAILTGSPIIFARAAVLTLNKPVGQEIKTP